VARGRGVACGAVNGSGGALRAAAANMESGAPPRGGRGRVLWLVSVEVSCCPDPVRAGVGSGVHGAGGFGAKWPGNCGGLSRLWADLVWADARLVL
jgi:hypothetical protein